jgi:hypothetical protein
MDYAFLREPFLGPFLPLQAPIERRLAVRMLFCDDGSPVRVTSITTPENPGR